MTIPPGEAPAGAMFWTATDDPLNRRACELCGLISDGSDCFGGPDPCLGRIPGVHGACCGHGRSLDTAHVWFEGGGGLSGDQARLWLRALGPGPPF